jgi:hypothetical protein
MRFDFFRRIVRAPRLGVRAQPRHVAAGLAGVAVGLAVAAVLVGSLLMRSAVAPSGSPHVTQVSSLSPVVAGSRYPGGIPKSLDGQPVYLGLAAVVHAAATTDATPFLVGGWFDDGSRNMCSGGGITVGTPDPDLFRSGCATVVGGDSPWGTYSWPGPQGWMAWNGHSLPGGVGPSIVRVHTHDPLSAQCSAESRASCEATLIVDDVRWTGDALTAASPISVVEAVARLDALSIQEQVPMAGGTLSVMRYVFPTVREQPCPSPWPTEVFDLHGDPRFALLAVFPDEASRVAAQPQLESSDTCPTDPRVVRPGAPLWVAQANVLVLVYGNDVAEATRKVLSTQSDFATIGFPAANVDESYRVVLDFLAARESGDLGAAPGLASADGSSTSKTPVASSTSYDAYLADAERRYVANALSFSIGPAQTPTKADVGAAAWKVLTTDAVPGTARLFEVDHPGSTVPALAHEVYVAYELKNPTVDSWALLLVDAAPWPPEV